MMRTVAKAVPDLKKIWATMADEDVRGTKPTDSANHVVLHGETKNHDEDFSNGLSYPRDPRGSAQDCCNCRCSMIPIFPQDAEATRQQLLELVEKK
jgi:hypothetical protein